MRPRLTERIPEDVRSWISQAFALLELDRVAEAKEVLLRALPLHGEKVALVHYNLASYECLLGNVAATKEQLPNACRMDAHCKETALDDSDLNSMADGSTHLRGTVALCPTACLSKKVAKQRQNIFRFGIFSYEKPPLTKGL